MWHREQSLHLALRNLDVAVQYEASYRNITHILNSACFWLLLCIKDYFGSLHLIEHLVAPNRVREWQDGVDHETKTV